MLIISMTVYLSFVIIPLWNSMCTLSCRTHMLWYVLWYVCLLPAKKSTAAVLEHLIQYVFEIKKHAGSLWMHYKI